MDREKVIKEAEEAIGFLSKAEEPTCWLDFVRCAFEDTLALLKEQGEQIKNRDESLEKAREEIKWLRGMLKEQEARVMTLDEVKSFDWDYCYLEEERLPGKEYREICGDCALTCITWPCIASMRIQHGDDRYGKKWRCWSAKPTDEQRQAVKWDG